MRLSISHAWRAEACPGSTVLPTTGRAFADADRGKDLHAVEEANAPAGSAAEVAFAYDVATGSAREIGRNIGRNYGRLSPTEIPGSCDMVTVEPARIVINDHKSGFGYHVPPADKNLQLHAYALAACRAYGRNRALVRIRFLDGTRPDDEAELDALDLAAVAKRLRAVWDEAMRAQAAVAEGREPRVVAGDHCWRCPCFSRCPAQRELALVVATGKLPAELPVLDLSREAVGRGWPMLMAYKKLLGEVERAYRAFASAEPVPLGPGRWLGPVSKKREELDGAVAMRVLREKHGAEVAALAVEMTTSKAAMERAIATVAQRGQKASLMRAALDAITAEGGVRAKWSTGVEEYEDETNEAKAG